MSNSIDLKKSNQNKVYRYIYENDGPVSKYDLMERLDLSLPTVNLILKHLTAEPRHSPTILLCIIPSDWTLRRIMSILH